MISSSGSMKRWVIVPVACIVIGLMPALAGAVPIVDGRFDPAEGYAAGSWVNLYVEAGKGTTVAADDGMLWMYCDGESGDLYVNFVQPVTLVDNSYGDNSVGWGKGVAPSGKNHSFGDLVGSDKAQFTVADSSGTVLLDFVLDYISPDSSSPSGYGSLGAIGGDGEILQGDASNILNWATSLDYNFNSLGYILTDDSPATDGDYTDNPQYPGWEFEVTYEFQISGELLDGRGFCMIGIPVIHDSPNKIAKNKVYTVIDGQIPEPATIALFGIGSLAAIRRRRRS